MSAIANKSAKKSNPVTSLSARRVIKLDASQYALYQSGQIEIQSPSGEQLALLGTEIDRIQGQIECEKLRNQFALIESLMINSNGFIELHETAVAGLAEAIGQAQTFMRH